MTEVVDPAAAQSKRRRPSFDRLDLVCLAWAGVFTAVTATLAIILR